MTTGLIVRGYLPSDLPEIKRIHQETQIDYRFPNVESPLFMVKKVAVLDGKVVAAGALYIQLEAYLWMSPEEWGTDREKCEVVKELNAACMREAYLQGVDQCVIYVPPGMERFGQWLVDNVGFTKDRDGWVHYSRRTEDAT